MNPQLLKVIRVPVVNKRSLHPNSMLGGTKRGKYFLACTDNDELKVLMENLMGAEDTCGDTFFVSSSKSSIDMECAAKI